MSGHRRSIHSLITLLIVMLGLAMVAPAGIAAQDDDEDGDTSTILTIPVEEDEGDEDTSAEVVTTDEDAGTDDGDQDDGGASDDFIMPDEVDADPGDANPPDCDDDGWRIVTTEDNAAFASEDHCEDHVAEHGAKSLVTLGFNEDDEYIALTLVTVSGGCKVMVTLVNGRPDQVISVTIDTMSGQRLLAQFTPDSGDVSDIGVIRFVDELKGGIAKVLTLDYEPTGEQIPIYPNAWGC